MTSKKTHEAIRAAITTFLGPHSSAHSCAKVYYIPTWEPPNSYVELRNLTLTIVNYAQRSIDSYTFKEDYKPDAVLQVVSGLLHDANVVGTVDPAPIRLLLPHPAGC